MLSNISIIYRDNTIYATYGILPIKNSMVFFIKIRFTRLQLLHKLDKWTEYLDYGGQTDAVYCEGL